MSWIYHITNQFDSMTSDEMNNNATLIKEQLEAYGWSLNAICGLLGNVQLESYINPAQWQNGYPVDSRSGGYGLVQWTPSSKYTDWCTGQGYDITDGSMQVHNIHTQASGTEYYPTASYPLTYDEFKISLESPSYLALVFLKNYERAGDEKISKRQEYANNWYQYFSGQPPVPPKPSKRKGMPLWFYIL